MRFLFVMDPIESIQIELDSTDKLLVTTEARYIKLTRLVNYLSELMQTTTDEEKETMCQYEDTIFIDH